MYLKIPKARIIITGTWTHVFRRLIENLDNIDKNRLGIG